MIAAQLATTRGTASQTLMTLAEKGLIVERAEETDRRQRNHDLAAAGRELAGRLPGEMPRGPEPEALVAASRTTLRGRMAGVAGPMFGFCNPCGHDLRRDGQLAYFELLGIDLSVQEHDQICGRMMCKANFRSEPFRHVVAGTLPGASA